LKPEDIIHVNKSLTSNNIESVIKQSHNKEKPRTQWFIGTFKEELIPTLLKLFHKMERTRTLSTHPMKPVLY
jgi:hypothetical protein